MDDVLEHLLLYQNAGPRELPLSLLRGITDNFADDQKIGEDRFSKVYMSVLENGTVAVKRLFQSGDMDEQRFINEVVCLMRMKHKNIVRLLGYCSDICRDVSGLAYESPVRLSLYVGSRASPLAFQDTRKEMVGFNSHDVRQRLLCFEYPTGGKLDAYITDASRGLDWRKRYKIIKGICEGLYYLHQNLTVHLDLKPANIWLNEKQVPKIHGFGSSRHLEEERSEVFTQYNIGSPEYMAPEFLENGVITLKADIYSLGVLITEILTGQMGGFIVENILESWSDRLGMTLEDTRLQQVRVCAEIGIRCLDLNRKKRPAAGHIVRMLIETESMNEFTPDDEQLAVWEKKRDFRSLKGAVWHRDVWHMEQGNWKQEEDHCNTGSIIGSKKTMELNILERILAGSEEPSHLDLSLLWSITENFSEQTKIGVGGCGEVYKGILRNGVVAVKRLFKIRTIKDKMFHREVKSLITARHQNIVRLLGYCSYTEEHALPLEGGIIMADVRERLLCFEYISNGNLENHLTDELRGLEWHTRYEIIVGICKGLLYLHKEKDIVHMDLKPANILLDDLMVPKITDFGLSRLDNNSQAVTTSRLMSPGYSAPEYVFEGKSSSKSDIYSLGVMVRELVTGSKKKPNLEKVLRRWRHRWNESPKHTPLDYQQVTKCLELAERCMQIDPTSRPNIVDITHELNAMDSKDDQFQIIPCLEDMLGIEPLEIHFPFELDPQISHSIELTNDMDDYIGFMTKARLCCFCIKPDMGIVPPRSKCIVTVTMQSQVKALLNNHCEEKITVLSTRVDGCGRTS